MERLVQIIKAKRKADSWEYEKTSEEMSVQQVSDKMEVLFATSNTFPDAVLYEHTKLANNQHVWQFKNKTGKIIYRIETVEA